MPFLAFIGRTYTVWPERLVLIHLPFHCSCCRTSSPHFRSTVLFLFGSGSSSMYPQVISYSSVPVLVLLLSVRQDPLVWVSLPSRWMDALLVCYVFGWFSSALFHQSVSLWYESPSYQTTFCRSSSQLSSLAACYTRHQRTQGSPSSSRLPITDDLILVIWKSWNLQLPDHCMFWAGCTLEHFGLCGPRNSVPSLASFSPLDHLDMQDITVDSSTDPSCIPVTIKASKTDPFRKGCSIYIGKYPLCALHVLLAYLAICGDGPALCFFVKRGNLSRVLYSPTGCGKLWCLQEFLVIFQATASE